MGNFVSLSIEIGDAINSYQAQGCDEFIFYNPWSRLEISPNISWANAGWGERENLALNLPMITTLDRNYPNPFNATTNISFNIATEGNVSLQIYNLAGQLVEILIDSPMEAGYHSVNWDASAYSSGIYFYKLTAGDYVTTRKMNLVNGKTRLL